MLHLQKFARWYSVLYELKFKLLTVFFYSASDGQCFIFKNFAAMYIYFSEHFCSLWNSTIQHNHFFFKQVTKDYFYSIFSWLYYLLLQIPPIKITVVYAKYFQILKSIESNWDSNLQTYGTTKPNTNFSIS